MVDRTTDVLMVVGDLGGANVVSKLCPIFKEAGLSVQIIADGGPAAKAHIALEKNNLPFERVATGEDLAPSSELMKHIQNARLIFTTPCVTAYHTGAAAANYGAGLSKTIVLGPGLDFDHAYPYWVKCPVDCVIANNPFQQRSILNLRANLVPAQAPILGNPLFDFVPSIILEKDEIRQKLRESLQIQSNKKMILYWSPGERQELCEASFKALVSGLKGIARHHSDLALCLRLHPKLNETIYPGYREEKKAFIQRLCGSLGIHFLAGGDDIKPEELNCAADLVVAERATQAMMAAICGIPTVFTLLPEHQKFFMEVLSQNFPFLSVLDEEAAVGIYQPEEVAQVLDAMLPPSEEVAKKLRYNAARIMPRGDAAEKTALFIKAILDESHGGGTFAEIAHRVNVAMGLY